MKQAWLVQVHYDDGTISNFIFTNEDAAKSYQHKKSQYPHVAYVKLNSQPVYKGLDVDGHLVVNN